MKDQLTRKHRNECQIRVERDQYDATLFCQRRDIGGEIACFDTRERHVRHFRVWVEKEEGKSCRIKIGLSCDYREWWRFSSDLALIRSDDLEGVHERRASPPPL
jgi:hypothetical protein